MFLRQLDLTTALRPSLYPDETLLFVQDSVGLYEGKYKIDAYQNGAAYLTSHRICYVGNAEPRTSSVAIDLKDVDHPEFYAGFLKSSPKISLFPKAPKRTSLAIRSPVPTYSSLQAPSTASPPRYGTPARHATSSPAPARDPNATWICPICSFSNPVPSNFDPSTANAYTPLPPCLACGIKPPLVHVVKAAIAAMSNRPTGSLGDHPSRSSSLLVPSSQPKSSSSTQTTVAPTPASFIECPRCTFQNHPSLNTCEICGASLPDRNRGSSSPATNISRTASPGPTLSASPSQESGHEIIKLSFRAGGEKVFHERLKGALVQRKWLLTNAPPVTNSQSDSGSTVNADGSIQPAAPQRKNVGIAGLERRGQELRKNNEIVIGSAFEDLEALMTSAKEVIAMAERFAAQSNNGASAEASALLSESASALGLTTTKDMLGTGSSSESLYITELSRNLAEYLTDDKRGVLRREGGIMSLVDLWAVFNRTRNGIELISPLDFEKAAQMWDQLRLPIRLRRFKSGLLVVQGRDRTDEKTIAALLAWMQEMHSIPPDAYLSPTAALAAPAPVAWDWRLFGRGVTAQELAERMGWSIGVAVEELDMAEEKGAVCREQGVDGIRFWENHFTVFAVDLPRPGTPPEVVEERRILKRLEESGLI